MVVDRREAHVGALVRVERRHDVEQREARDAVAVVEREPMRDARAAVVADDGEAFVAERSHQRRHVGGHRALAVLRVVELGRRRRSGLGRVAVAAQVGNDDAKVGREPDRDAPPHRVRLRIAVQKEQRRSAGIAADASEERRAAGVVQPARESVEPAHSVLLVRPPPRFWSVAGRVRSYTRRPAPICSGLRALYKFG